MQANDFCPRDITAITCLSSLFLTGKTKSDIRSQRYRTDKNRSSAFRVKVFASSSFFRLSIKQKHILNNFVYVYVSFPSLKYHALILYSNCACVTKS